LAEKRDPVGRKVPDGDWFRTAIAVPVEPFHP
jgi:hypothetical protein